MQIHESPEVKRWVAANNCVDVGRFGPYAFLRVKNSRDSISIAPGKMTLSQLLDKTAAQTGVGFWAISQSGPLAKSCRVSIVPW
jgi:hypothetical protein